MYASLFVVILGLCFCSTGSSQSTLGIPRLFGPTEFTLRQVVEIYCDLQIYPKNETILLQLFQKGDPEKLLGEFSSLNGEVGKFLLVGRSYHEGNLECVARAQNNSNIEPTVSKTHYLKFIEPVKDAKIDIRSVSKDFFEGETLELLCHVKAGTHVSYKWLLNGRPVSQSALHYDHVLINRTTPEDSGSYMCLATNYFNQTEFSASNSSVKIIVKAMVSEPHISFTVLKDDSHNFAVVTCRSTRGTPPVTFSLYNKTELVASTEVEERHADFKVPLVLDQHMGSFHCRANNGNQTAYSKEIPIEVVPVGGPVRIHYDYDTGDNYAVVGLRFYCTAAKGSLPRYQWFLNNTLLQDRGSFYYVVDQPPERSILLLSVGRESTGSYHCIVSDSFDNTNAISSMRRHIDKDALNRLPAFVVAIVFGTFTFLILLVSVCCCIGVVFRRQYEEKPLSGLEMARMGAVDDSKLELSGYSEDDDVVNAAKVGGFDQTSLVSEDEWPQIEEEKKTLEDEAVEEP